MYQFHLKGGDATALVGGTAVLIMCFVAILQHKPVNCLEKITDYIREGFVFGIKIFAPVIVIGAFFFLGSGMVRPDNSPVPLSGTNDCMKFIIKQCD